MVRPETVYLGGSGFKIHLPDVDLTAIVTSGHCTHVKGAKVTKIYLTFPGQQAIVVWPNDIHAAPEYVDTYNPDYDYGLILLPGRSDDGFGWSAIIPDEGLNNRLVTNCGYPVNKPRGTMWITGEAITRYTAKMIFYMNDKMGGQSGSPAYTWYGGYWTALGVHSYGGCPNSAPRFTREMISRFLARMNCLKIKCIRSRKFPTTYLRCDGGEVTKFLPGGGGTVNCWYLTPGDMERFLIYPVKMAPSLALDSIMKVAIESNEFRHVFIRMDSQGMSEPYGLGGGQVNCQFTVNTKEKYFLRQEANGGFSLRSVQFPHCYLRLDSVGADSDSYGGTVNYQWYADPSLPLPDEAWEIFYLE